jgi:beta-carotene ketolase (CrtW type)
VTVPEQSAEHAGQRRAHAPAVQAAIGLSLAVAIVGAWLAVHVGTLFVADVTSPLAIIALIALQTWLSVGLFIVAHDAMHGTLVPFRPAWNRRVGQLCLLLYAGFPFDALNRAHHRHHRAAGTADDPDFDPVPPHGFWSWYLRFMRTYFGWREFAAIVAVVALYQFVLAVPLWKVLTFWAAPALLSSIQLFTFGTYLPHRPGEMAFTDRHRTRSNDWPAWLSLITCFHFGYHHEHHDRPDVPWWRLPALRAAAGRSGRNDALR